MRSASAEVSVEVVAQADLSEIAQALLVLDDDGEVTLDAPSGSAWLDTGWSWRSSGGERVTVEIDEHVIRVTSQSRNTAVVDYGKNQANVKAVIAALQRVPGRPDLSD
jgi:hypothetical protein